MLSAVTRMENGTRGLVERRVVLTDKARRALEAMQ